MSNGAVGIFSWRRALPLVQIALALLALVYAPYQYRAAPHPSGDDFMLLGYRQSWPPSILRISYAVNFPAWTAAYSVQFARWASREVVHYQDRVLLSLTVQECLFLLSVGVLWSWLGAKLDVHVGRSRAPRSSEKLNVVSLTMGFAFTAAVAGLAMFYASLTEADRAWRQIGPFGLAWAAALFAHFARKLLRRPTPNAF